MYIKEIKIYGFKSFAEKLTIELDPTFTGIVGPNGSGKSNIVDAIKWVLGEQSVKSLRGSNNMTDVIFTGSSSRPASNFASVCIVFDNTDRTLNIDYSEADDLPLRQRETDILQRFFGAVGFIYLFQSNHGYNLQNISH